MAVKQIIHGFILFEDFFGHPLFQLLSGCLGERLELNSDKVIYFVSDKHFKIKTQDKCSGQSEEINRRSRSIFLRGVSYSFGKCVEICL